MNRHWITDHGMRMTLRYWLFTRVPRYWAPVVYWSAAALAVDKLPWFARKRLLNLMVGHERFTA